MFKDLKLKYYFPSDRNHKDRLRVMDAKYYY